MSPCPPTDLRRWLAERHGGILLPTVYLKTMVNLYVVHDKLEEVREVIKVSGGCPIMQPESGGSDMI